MRSVLFRLCLAASLLTVGLEGRPVRAQDNQARASEPPAPSKPIAPDQRVLSFTAGHPDCTEITDECIICAVVNGKPMCSTPGIACLRKDLRCTSTKPPTPKQ
ncbi:hypothetical protein C5L14_08010 [Labrys okinawensis]|uniref:Uncharacterized protein n=1 Tax=Labrys okinawensis TaxID=346911 RepID=A0A2S9QES1_9HYPH|nr:hypothetical protein [Labrys okinawensis]PRH87847.1 hypothetical protein C5L14_08010 [Labrys okinawensis]